MTLTQKIQAFINAANAKMQTSYSDMTNAGQALIDGYQGGGGGTVVPVNGSATPEVESKVYVPTDFGSQYTHFARFTVNSIPVARTDNVSGGVTVTIG